MTTSPQDPESAAVRREFQVHLDTLRELGPEYADPLAQSFMDKFERLVDARIDARLAGRGASPAPATRSSDQQLKVLAVTLALGIPTTVVAGSAADVYGIIVVWIGLSAVSYFSQRR